MAATIRLGDVVVPTEDRTITCGCGLVGWGPDTQHPGLVEQIDGGRVQLMTAPRVLVDELGSGVSRFWTSITKLRKVDACMVPIRAGRVRT